MALAFDLRKLVAEHRTGAQAYREFLRVPALSLGLYKLAAGATDPQKPHAEDEVYYVVNGRGRIRIGDEDVAVQEGSIVFVGAAVEHRFFDISEDLELLVFFAPAEQET